MRHGKHLLKSTRTMTLAMQDGKLILVRELVDGLTSYQTSKTIRLEVSISEPNARFILTLLRYATNLTW